MKRETENPSLSLVNHPGYCSISGPTMSMSWSVAGIRIYLDGLPEFYWGDDQPTGDKPYRHEPVLPWKQSHLEPTELWPVICLGDFTTAEVVHPFPRGNATLIYMHYIC